MALMTSKGTKDVIYARLKGSLKVLEAMEKEEQGPPPPNKSASKEDKLRYETRLWLEKKLDPQRLNSQRHIDIFRDEVIYYMRYLPSERKYYLLASIDGPAFTDAIEDFIVETILENPKEKLTPEKFVRSHRIREEDFTEDDKLYFAMRRHEVIDEEDNVRSDLGGDLINVDDWEKLFLLQYRKNFPHATMGSKKDLEQFARDDLDNEIYDYAMDWLRKHRVPVEKAVNKILTDPNELVDFIIYLRQKGYEQV